MSPGGRGRVGRVGCLGDTPVGTVKAWTTKQGGCSCGVRAGQPERQTVVCRIGGFFETGSHCTALAGLELAYIDQAGLQLTDIYMPLPSEC